MQTQALKISITLLALVGAVSLAVAQTPTPAPAANPAAAGPSFGASDEIPNPKGFSDAYSLDEIRLGGKILSEDEQIARWKAELGAGRARAGTLTGAYLAYRALTPADCEEARAVLTKADELGSDQAPWLLAQAAANETCGPPDRAQRELWLKKAVPLDYPSAALELIRMYGAAPVDRLQQYLYARVAGGYWESTKASQPRTGFDAQALLDMEKELSAADRGRAEADAAVILEQMLKRHGRFVPASPVEFARGDAGAKTTFVAWQSDYRHECQWNLKNNCRGAQRLAYLELTSKNSEFLTCKVELRARDFVSGAPVTEPLTRQVLLGPAATRRLVLGDVNTPPDKKSVVARCAPVPRLAANSAAGRCRARLNGSVDVQRFYPDSAKSRGIEGSTVVRYWVPPSSDVATDAEVVTSSGNADLDEAAISTVRSGKFTVECDYGLSSIRIAFKLQD